MKPQSTAVITGQHSGFFIVEPDYGPPPDYEVIGSREVPIIGWLVTVYNEDDEEVDRPFRVDPIGPPGWVDSGYTLIRWPDCTLRDYNGNVYTGREVLERFREWGRAHNRNAVA